MIRGAPGLAEYTGNKNKLLDQSKASTCLGPYERLLPVDFGVLSSKSTKSFHFVYFISCVYILPFYLLIFLVLYSFCVRIYNSFLHINIL